MISILKGVILKWCLIIYVVTGAKTVVEAVVQAKVVAETIEEYCKKN